MSNITLKVTSACGLFFIVGLAFALSENKTMARRHGRIIVSGIALQLLLAVFILKTEVGLWFFASMQDAIESLVAVSDAGAEFLFGKNFTEHFFAFKVLPTIIFISALSALLFHWGIMQRVVNAIAMVMQRVMGLSGPESLVAAANIFLGQTEAPLVVRPYLLTMSRSEVMVMMCSGMASVAGGVLAAYVGMGIPAGHLVAASIMSAPASVVLSKLMVPETVVRTGRDIHQLSVKSEDENALAAACRGAGEGLQLALNVAAMLIAFIALVSLINIGLSKIGVLLSLPLSLQSISGVLFAPFAWLLGIQWDECLKIGSLIGQRMILNEFVAYGELATLIKDNAISQRSATIATYALCGFANLSSIAIQIGGIGALEPGCRKKLAQLGFRSMIGGTLACFMTACIAGVLV